MSETSFLIECAKRLAGHNGHDWLCGSHPSEAIVALKMCTLASVPDDQTAELVQMLSNEIGRLQATLRAITDGAEWCGLQLPGAAVNANLWRLPNCDGRLGTLLEAAEKARTT